jgi:hypothetical protein
MSSSQDRARALAIAQDFGAEALKLNGQLVAADATDVASRTRLARCYREAGRIEESEAQYREVLRIDPRNRIASGGLASIDQDRRRGAEAIEEASAPRAQRARRAAAPARRTEASHAPSETAVPLIFNGFQRDFAELRSCPPREARARFAPRVVDLIKRINALASSEEIASIREPGRRQLFRLSRTDVHVEPAQWFVYNIGGRWEPQFNIGMYAGTGKVADWVRVGIGFHLANDGADSEGATGARDVRNRFRRLQAILASPQRSLFLGWMIKENGLIEFNENGPRLDLRQPSEAADLLAGCDAEREQWVFFGKWLSPDQAEDAAVLSDAVEFVRTVDRVFIGLLPLWRALWE